MVSGVSRASAERVGSVRGVLRVDGVSAGGVFRGRDGGEF